MAIPFIKMHGLGNDFVLIDDLGKPAGLCHPLNAELARAMCDRRLGIGADQLLWLRTPSDKAPSPDLEGAKADARMDIFNADGSVAEMCGNGIRAAALYLYRHGPKRKPEYDIETLAGIKRVIVKDGQVRVDMGAPGLGAMFGASATAGGEAITVLGQELRFFEVDMGNPHAVIFVDDVASCELEKLGPAIEAHPRFPRRTNVEFVQVQGAREIQVRVWERGAGPTLACGTGACASAVASLATGRVQGTVEVHLPGGVLSIQWNGGQGPVWMEGPAEEVFRGQYLE
jgi:diaminopimelate epimerase